MIYTLTLNPSLDYHMSVSKIAVGSTNRSDGEKIFFGGKGINVSYILYRLGINSVCLGFTAGFTGEKLEEMLKKEGLACDFIRLSQGDTRINVKLCTNEITEINARGITANQNNVDALYEKLLKLKRGDILVLAGSVPYGLDGNVYEKIMQHLSERDIKFVIDTHGNALKQALKHEPYLIKPNFDELCDLFGKRFETQNEIIEAMQKLQESGAVNVLTSLGDKGALLLDEYKKVHIAHPIKITPHNTVGAGDGMVAGFLAGLDKGYEYALRLGNLCGASCARRKDFHDSPPLLFCR